MSRLSNKIKQLNKADYFSLYRFVSLPLIILAIINDVRVFTAILLLISFITDAIDGYLARKNKMETSRGAMLDSVGDLLTLLAGLAAFIAFETEFFKDHLVIIVVSFSLYAVQVLLAYVKFKKLTSYHTYLAKIAAVFFASFLVVTFIVRPYEILFYFTFAVGIAEAVEEIVITAVLEEPKKNVKGLYWILKAKLDFTH